MVSMIIMTLVISLATSVLFLSSNMYQRDVTIGAFQGVGDGALNLLCDRLEVGMNVCISEKEPSNVKEYSEVYYIYMTGENENRKCRLYCDTYKDDGSVKESERDVFGDEFYLGGNLYLYAEKKSDNLVTISAEIYSPTNQYEPMYISSRTVRLLNVGKSNDAVFICDSGELSSEDGLYICIK